MEVVTGGDLNREFKKIEEYKVDLGIAVHIDEGQNGKDRSSGGDWKIKDKTIRLYYDSIGRYLNRIGKIGTLLFYVDYDLNDKDLYIIHDGEIFKSEYDNSKIRTFLSKMIEDVLGEKLEPYMKIIPKKEEFVDIKNMSNKELADYFAKKSRA